jgi:hypothetical protein
MGKGKKAIIAAQIKEEMRKLNLIGKSEIRRSFDEEAAVGLILRIGVTGDSTEEPATPAKPVELSISPVIKYRLLVGGVGIVDEGKSEPEEGRPFNLLMAESNPKD